ncbi:hypothetical protein MHC_04830 [Mycoplasma haemocanis str. Illinois]|uniref:Uncharacterized protein n=1 Tax=Mycoplasma haemocanis (strain Illinois) TaxID=1111676 RepID=H6N850_MYCHN|nr:hypothetical protein [Mycoplasma haemocanis]AEW45822.1 hypothetical protein MHC_04830 [Mycoplasma haemocanis str. Illinois]
MASSLIPKAVAVGSFFGGMGAIFSEVGVGSSENLLSSKIEDNSISKTSNSQELKKKIPNKGVCNVFWVEFEFSLSSGSGSATRRLTEINEDFWTEQEFLEKLKKNPSQEDTGLSEKVRSKCSQGGLKTVYVEWDRTHKKWLYRDDVNNNRDWLNETSVKVPVHFR